MWVILIPLAAGYAFASVKPGWAARLPVGAVANGSLVLLLLVMGASLGANRQIVDQLGVLGGQALFMAWATVVGSVLAVYLLSRVLPGIKGAMGADNAKSRNNSVDLKQTAVLLTVVLVGFALGLTVAKGLLPLFTEAAVWLLGLLLLGVGLDLGQAGQVFSALRQLGPKIILVPLGILIGSLAGGILTALVWKLAWREGAAVASGFGWYSLSSVIIAEAHSPVLGALAFLANVFRELIAIIITPLVARRLGPLTAVAPGGATTMDVLLPVITKSAGPEYAPLAFFSGALLSMAVPLFVNIFL